MSQVISILYGLTVVIFCVTLILESKIFTYILQRPFIIRWSSYTSHLLILALVMTLVLFIAEYISPDVVIITKDIILVSSLFLIFLVIRYLIYYRTLTDSFGDLTSVQDFYDTFLRDDQEVIVVHLRSHPQLQDYDPGVQIVPMKNLRASDLILTIPQQKENAQFKYSLTYCLLCNTVHAYPLPELDGKPIPISSNHGSILNGNKILTDTTGKYIWQQMTGEAITDSAAVIGNLTELSISRTIWKHAQSHYPNGRYYKQGVNPVTYVIFKTVGWLIRVIPFLKFSRAKASTALGNKTIVIGVHLFPGARAYPLNIFEETALLEDEVDGNTISVLYSLQGSIAFKGHGYTIDTTNQVIQKGSKHWDYTGRALDNGDDLELLHVTDKVYWYLWSQFYPNTSLYIAKS